MPGRRSFKPSPSLFLNSEDAASVMLESLSSALSKTSSVDVRINNNSVISADFDNTTHHVLLSVSPSSNQPVNGF